jgi:DNA polymerase-1
MERAGVRLDGKRLGAAAGEIRGHLDGLAREIRELAGRDFNILSPKQVGEVLFGDLKLPAGKRTKTGFSTDEAVLEELAAGHRAPAAILEYRKLSKLLGTYLEPLPDMCVDGLLHTTWHQLGASTGRISSSDPNLQNIPIRGKWGSRIRGAFVPRRAGLLLLSCDYSQVELRILAHMCQDGPFLEAFRRGDDIHAATAAGMFGKTPSAVTPDERRSAKAVNFGIIYGMTAYGLSRELKCPPGVAKDYLDRYFARHPAVRAFMDATLESARAQGWVTTLFGRRRRFPEISSESKLRREEAEREALNHPVQGTAADLLKLAMIRVADSVPDATLLLTIHDELLFEVPAGDAKRIAGRVREAMEGVASLSVPLVAEPAWGASWAECHP